MTARVLLLNCQNKPIQVCSWKQALLLIIKGKAKAGELIEVIDNLDNTIKCDNIIIPNVIKLNYEIAVPDLELPFCRENIFIRDDFTCQYCGKKFSASELTLDHVYPKSRFGPDIWENIVTCCKECNQYKANRTPKECGMKLLRRPYRPNNYMEFEFQKHKSESEYWQKFLSA